MKVLVTGANGLLGSDLCPYLDNLGLFVIPTDVESMDVTNEKQTKETILNIRPDLIIHCAGYTNVDKAEQDIEAASKINVLGTKNVAKASCEINATMVYISTDYVFDGKKNTPYLTSDTPNPINNYGSTKYKGELEVQKHCKKHFIIRTSWLYGAFGNNFVETMIRFSKNDELKVVNDQIGCPTWTIELIQGILKILNQPYGIYHINGSGNTTWYDFAKEIFKILNIKTNLKPCTSDNYKQLAIRPAYSVMQSSVATRDWKESLVHYLKYRDNYNEI